MDLEIEYRIMPEYLAVIGRGTWTRSNGRKLIEAIREEAEKCQKNKILLDLVEFSPPDQEVTRFYNGVDFATILPPPFKVAIIGKKEMINRLGENAAVNRGAWIKVTSDENTALEWLSAFK